MNSRIEKAQEKKNENFKLSKYDKKVLNAIRNNHGGHQTSSVNNYRFDNRYKGSSTSRRAAKLLRRRGTE